ncbi:Uncharacterized protein DAT39_014374 [Clarias magur]|uniref:Uncharacterized protein n=1 Tax=Clarias magur TaxID=1594786 RepID=A0A8J4TR92_CLAMG|nr:Uncharacterized protein DAT39_014374 [Clarias magur]
MTTDSSHHITSPSSRCPGCCCYGNPAIMSNPLEEGNGKMEILTQKPGLSSSWVCPLWLPRLSLPSSGNVSCCPIFYSFFGSFTFWKNKRQCVLPAESVRVWVAASGEHLLRLASSKRERKNTIYISNFSAYSLASACAAGPSPCSLADIV